MSIHTSANNEELAEASNMAQSTWNAIASQTALRQQNPFETLVGNFCSIYNKKEGRFEINPEMIYQTEETYHHARCDEHSPIIDVHRFVQGFGNNYMKKWGSATWINDATWINEPFGKGHDQNYYPLPENKFNDCVLKNMRIRSYSLGRNGNVLHFVNAKHTMFEMCKQMFCTPKLNVQNMLLCFKRGAPRLYAVKDVVLQFEGYLKLDFTEQDFIKLMKSDQGALVLRLYCCWWILTTNHVLANPETLTKVSSTGKRKIIDNANQDANVFVHDVDTCTCRRPKRRRF